MSYKASILEINMESLPYRLANTPPEEWGHGLPKLLKKWVLPDRTKTFELAEKKMVPQPYHSYSMYTFIQSEWDSKNKKTPE